ncbi:unnamed protein product [marine sediment metagenome]|uniref:Uncharacterized protein n=1 Tax=marine sediment metagenome TaxID=412755 RepID=X1MJ47_9ZZZZ
MEKINFLKGVAKILLGFAILHTIGNIYFAISGKFPSKPSLSIMPSLTPTINIVAIILGLIIVGVLIYLLYLRKNSDKFIGKDVLAMIAGSFFIGVLIGIAKINFFVILISLFLILVFAYLSFKK